MHFKPLLWINQSNLIFLMVLVYCITDISVIFCFFCTSLAIWSLLAIHISESCFLWTCLYRYSFLQLLLSFDNISRYVCVLIFDKNLHTWVRIMNLGTITNDIKCERSYFLICFSNIYLIIDGKRLFTN